MCQGKKKLDCLLLASIRSFLRPPPATRPGKMCTWRESNHHVPFVAQDVQNIALVVLTWFFAWQDVTACCVMALLCKCIPDSAGVFAGNKYFHVFQWDRGKEPPPAQVKEVYARFPGVPANRLSPVEAQVLPELFAGPSRWPDAVG